MDGNCHSQVVASCAMIAEIEQVFLLHLHGFLLLTISVSNPFVNEKFLNLTGLPDDT